MSNALSLQPSSSSNAAYDACKTNQRLQPAHTSMRDIPLAVIKHAMSFLPFEDVTICKRVFKALDLDYLKWVKLSGYFKGDPTFYYLRKMPSQKSKFEPKGAFPLLAGLVDVAKEKPASRFLSHLRTLDLSDVWEGYLQDEIFSGLEGEGEEPLFPNLRKINFGHTAMPSEETLDFIAAQAPGVTDLELEWDEDAPSFCKQLAHLERLVIYDGDKLDASTLRERCPKLRECEIFWVEKQWAEVAKIPQLSVALGRVSTDKDLEPLIGHPQLRELSIRDSWRVHSVTDQGLRYLTRIPHLRHLTLELADVCDISCLADAKSLRKLTLGGFDITCVGKEIPGLMKSLQTVKNVRELVLYIDFTEASFAAIGTLLHLHSLTVNFAKASEPMTDKALAHLASCKELRFLALKTPRSCDPSFGLPPQCLENFFRIPDSGNVFNYLEFTTEGMIDLAEGLPHLKVLDVNDEMFPHVDADEIEEALADTRPEIFVKKEITG